MTEAFADFDNRELELGGDGTPFATLTALRDRIAAENSYIGWTKRQGGHWVVAGWDEAWGIYRDPETFRIKDAQLPPFTLPSGRPLMLAGYDGETHKNYRRLVQGWFNPPQVATMSDALREGARSLIEAFVDRGRADLGAELAWLVPFHAVARILGVDWRDSHLFSPWIRAMAQGAGSAVAGTQEHLDAMEAWFADYVDEKRKNPTDDVMSDLIRNGKVDGRPLTHQELQDYFTILLLGTVENTSLLLSGASWILARNPELRERLRTDLDLLPASVDEFLRFLSPGHGQARIPTRDVEIAGQEVKAGQKVLIYAPLINRDPRKFDRPDDFVPDRTPNPHLALSNGPHRCLGANLIRVEVVAVLTELLTALPDFALDPEVPVGWHQGGPSHGLRSVPVVF
ncbi:cytochrome P450 [Microbacterium sp.]|uniref:cytochrome P450 n=1 Tax=Microbacterium sp. TaxID=51671 RepID=UPI003A8F15BD